MGVPQAKKAIIRRGLAKPLGIYGNFGLKTADSFTKTPSLLAAAADQRTLFSVILIFGSFVNLLVLTGPIFALQVYDRVLGSRSVETLVALSLLMVFLFIVMGVLDHARKRIASRVGERIVSALEPLIFNPRNSARERTVGDLEIIRNFFASPLFIALMDVIWVPLFLSALAILHPILGWFGVAGCAAFLIPAIWNISIRSGGQTGDQADFNRAAQLVGIVSSGPELTHGISATRAIFPIWRRLRSRVRDRFLSAQDQRALMASFTQTFRMFMQSAMIALGAYLVLDDSLTPGAIIAATVLLARAIGPLDMLSQNTPTLGSLIQAWRRLSLQEPPKTDRQPKTFSATAGLIVDQITVFPPDQRRAALRMVAFDLQPANVLGVVGPADSGKSTLARAITGIWPTAGGTLRYGGAQVRDTGVGTMGQTVGYLPQNPTFMPGSISQNITGFSKDDCPKNSIDAAISVGAHEQILALPDGYETLVSPTHVPFSGGLFQRIAIARAIFKDPPLLVLDEPLNNLDQDGVDMVSELIQSAKSKGNCMIVLSRTNDILKYCDQMFNLEGGIQKFCAPLDIAIGTQNQRPFSPMTPAPLKHR